MYLLVLAMCVSCSNQTVSVSDVHDNDNIENSILDSNNANNNGDDSQYTFSITQDGVNAQCNNDLSEFYVCSYNDQFIFLNGTIFFALQDGLYTLRGNERHRLISGKILSFADADGWICFSNSDGIYKIRYDGTELTRIATQSTHILTVVECYVYYIIEDTDISKQPEGEQFYHIFGQLAQIDIYGENNVIYEISSVVSLGSYDGVLYFLQESANAIYTMNIANGEINVLCEGLSFVETIEFYRDGSEDWMIVVDQRNIIKISLADGTIKPLREGGWNYILCIYDGYIYFTDSLLIDTNTGDYGLRKMQIDSA
jgi:hypothetical protein